MTFEASRMNFSSTQQRTLFSIATLAAWVLLLNIMAEFTIQIWPLKFGELNWRVGTAGLLIDAFVKTLPAQIVLWFAAAATGARTLLRVYGILALVLALTTIVVLGFFALDAVQMRAVLPQNVKGTFLKVALRAALMGTLLTGLFILAFVRVNSVLKSLGVARSGGRAVESDEGMLLVARPGAPAAPRPNLTAVKGDEAKPAEA
jgi:hypothetical protein